MNDVSNGLIQINIKQMIFLNQQNLLNCISNLLFKIIFNPNTFTKMLTRTVKNLFLAITILCSSMAYSQTLDEAIKHLDAERYTAAAKAFDNLSKTTPTAVNMFYKGYGLLRSPEGNQASTIKEAAAAFEAGAALDKKELLPQIGMGMIKLASKDMAGAKLIFDELKKSTKSKNDVVLYRIAEAYTLFPGATDPAEALMNINLAIEKSKLKDNPEYYFVKSDAFMLKNEGGDAMNALANSERLGKKLGRNYEKMSKIWLQSRNYKEASAAIAKGVAADPTHAPIYKFESSYLQTMGKYAESAVSAKKYLDNSDGDCKAKLRYAKLAFVAKDFAAVKKTIEEIKSCSTDPYVIRMNGIMNFEDGKNKEAIEELTKFIKAAPADENTGLDYGYIGRSYINMTGTPEEKKLSDSLGIMNVEKAVQLGDSSINYYQELSTKFFTTKNYPLSAKYAEKNVMTKKAPTAADFALVGTYYNYAKNWIKSDEYLDKALAGYQDKWADGYALSARVKTYKNSADSSYSAGYKSAPLYEKYLALIGVAGKADPKNKRNVVEAFQYLAGREFLLNKNTAKAIEFIDEAIKADPTNEKLKSQGDAIKGIKPVVVPPTTPAPTPGAPTTAPATKPGGNAAVTTPATKPAVTTPTTKPAGKVK